MANDTNIETVTPELPDGDTKVAPTVEETSTEEGDTEGKEGEPEVKEEQPEEKNRKQSRLDRRFKELTTRIKESAKEVSTWREALRDSTGEAPPERNKFTNIEDYQNAVEDYRDKIRTPKVMLQQAEKSAEKAEAEYNQTLVESWQHKVAAHSSEFPDYEQVVSSSTVPLPDHILKAILESDVGPRLAYHLASDVDAAYDLLALSPAKQLLELGKLEYRVQAGRKAEPAKVIQTKAPIPTPTAPLRGTAPTRAKSPGDMNLKEFAAWRAKGGGK